MPGGRGLGSRLQAGCVCPLTVDSPAPACKEQCSGAVAPGSMGLGQTPCQVPASKDESLKPLLCARSKLGWNTEVGQDEGLSGTEMCPGSHSRGLLSLLGLVGGTELVFSEGVTEQAPLGTTGSFSGLLFCTPAVAWWPMALSRSLP